MNDGVNEMSQYVRSLESAVVKWFNVEKRYGFLTVEGGGEIFFHYNDGKNMCANGEHLEWCLPPIGKTMPMPKPGDEVVFERSRGNQGPKAFPWTTKTVHEFAKKRIVVPTRYRVMIQYSYPGTGKTDEPRVEWEGTDLKDRKLNLVWDPKYDRATFSCSDFDSVKWFERLEGKNWIRCADPRTGY